MGKQGKGRGTMQKHTVHCLWLRASVVKRMRIQIGATQTHFWIGATSGEGKKGVCFRVTIACGFEM